MTDGGRLRILLDECVQAAALHALADDGHDVVRPIGSGTSESLSDEAVLEAAVAEDRILVTTDTDLLAVHGKWIAEGMSHAGVIIGQQDHNLSGTVLRDDALVHERPRRSSIGKIRVG